MSARPPVPAWIPRLDARTSHRHLVASRVMLFALCACLSYGTAATLSAIAAAFTNPPVGQEAMGLVKARTEFPTRSPDPVALEAAQSAPEPASPLGTEAHPPHNGTGPPAPAGSTLRVITGHVSAGGTVSGSLRARGVSPRTVSQIALAMLPIFNFRYARAGDFFSLIEDGEGNLLSFEFQRGRSDIYRIERGPGGELAALRERVPLERRVQQLAGVVRTSLFESILELGEHPDLVNAFADVFVWDFDFDRQTRPGDEFRMLFEKFYDREGFVRYGTVLGGQYRSGDRELVAVYFEDADGYGDYYTPEGHAMRRAFLRAPVRYSRISSRYSHSRLHPVLKVRRPHHGVDYAAPLGTPVWAVADGVVQYVGWNGGFGRLVRVRHANGYVSYYGHLSSFQKGLKTGARVKQKDVIGYVGTSGLSSGPHLDYRLKVNGRFVDPLKVRFPKGEPIRVEARSDFEEVKQARLAALAGASPPLVLEAAM